MAKEILITAQNAEFWKLALIARGNNVYASIGSWDTALYRDTRELREACDKLCKIRAYIDAIEELQENDRENNDN